MVESLMGVNLSQDKRRKRLFPSVLIENDDLIQIQRPSKGLER